MATHVSSEKRARQTIRRNALNRTRRSNIQNLVKAVETAIASNNPKDAKEALKSVESALARGAGKGLVHWKTAARKTSRLAARVKAISGAKKK
jgi:small subunit ribosomal protein S20